MAVDCGNFRSLHHRPSARDRGLPPGSLCVPIRSDKMRHAVRVRPSLMVFSTINGGSTISASRRSPTDTSTRTRVVVRRPSWRPRSSTAVRARLSLAPFSFSATSKAARCAQRRTYQVHPLFGCRTRIIPLSSLPRTSNNIIQKGLAFARERSGSVTIPGARCASGSCPAGCMAEVGLWWWRRTTPHQCNGGSRCQDSPIPNSSFCPRLRGAMIAELTCRQTLRRSGSKSRR